MRRLQYLLWPAARPAGLERLFPDDRIDPTPPVGVPRPTPMDRVRVTNFVERVLAFVPESYPSGTKAEQEVALVRWQAAHGLKDLYRVASDWKKEFADLAVCLHATLNHCFPRARGNDDLAAVVRELLERGVHIWEAERLFAIFRNGTPVSMAKREEAARWSVSDGQWVSDTLQQMLYTTPERFARFQETVRRVVGDMLDAKPCPERMTAANETGRPEPRPPGVPAAEHPVALPAVVRNWLTATYLADPTPTNWRRTPDAGRESVVFVRYEVVARFLLDQGMDVLSSLNRWETAGWIDDVLVELTPSPDPDDAPPLGVARLRLPLGRHRVVAIRRSVFDAPVESGPSSSPVSSPTPVASSGPEIPEHDPKNPGRDRRKEVLATTGVPVPTVAGTTWADVTLTVGDRTLTVTVGDTARRFTHAEVGFADRKAGGKPDRVWALLTLLATNGGMIPAGLKHGGVNKDVKQAVSELRSRLRAIVALKENPLPHNARDREYRAAFRVRADSPATFALPDGGGWESVAITERADGMIEIAIDGNGHADGFDDRAGDGGEPVAAVRTTAWSRTVSLTMLGLATGGVPTPEDEALLTVLRGRGTVRAKLTDSALLRLGKVLTTTFQTHEPAFDCRGGLWVAKFAADSHAHDATLPVRRP